MFKPAGPELRADLYAIPGVQLRRTDRALHVCSEALLAVLGSAIVGAELARTRHIVNMHVHKDYDGRAPGADLTALARAWGIVEPFVGLMTAARLDQAQVAIEEGAGATVAAIVTVGLSHPVAAGVTEAMHLRAGTINIILVVDARLTQAARVNAVSPQPKRKPWQSPKSACAPRMAGWRAGPARMPWSSPVPSEVPHLNTPVPSRPSGR